MKLPLIAVSVVSLGVALGSSAVAAPPTSTKCSVVKNAAAADAVYCHAVAQNKVLLGGTADPGKCDAKLERAFTKMDGTGACPLVGDYADVRQRVVDAEAAVRAALAAGSATTPSEKSCVTRKNAEAGRYARCHASAMKAALAGKQLPEEIYKPIVFIKCEQRLETAFLKAETRETCLTTGDVADVRGLVVGAATNFRLADASPARAGGADLRGADFRAADLTSVFFPFADLRGADLAGATLLNGIVSGADFTGADLTGVALVGTRMVTTNLTNANVAGADLTLALLADADVTGADLSGVTWSQTGCPDETTSDTNGSSPESCCANLQGAVPAACSP